MSTNLGAQAPTTTPVHHIYDLDDIQAHYRIGKTKAVELAALAGFPTSVVPGMYRYPAAAIHAYDHAVALAGTVADPATLHQPAPVVITRPAAARPGPKPRSASTPKAA